jgi:hypothetical protein
MVQNLNTNCNINSFSRFEVHTLLCARGTSYVQTMRKTNITSTYSILFPTSQLFSRRGQADLWFIARVAGNALRILRHYFVKRIGLLPLQIWVYGHGQNG